MREGAGGVGHECVCRGSRTHVHMPGCVEVERRAPHTYSCPIPHASCLRPKRATHGTHNSALGTRHSALCYAGTCSSISAPFGTTTMPDSVTVNFWRSASR